MIWLYYIAPGLPCQDIKVNSDEYERMRGKKEMNLIEDRREVGIGELGLDDEP